MRKDIADKWVAALRSGKYKQAREALMNWGAYCCLGVLQDLHDREVKKVPFDGMINDNGDELLHDDAKEWCEMRYHDGHVSDPNGCNIRVTLSSLNDKGYSFNQIADIIEKEWKNL